MYNICAYPCAYPQVLGLHFVPGKLHLYERILEWLFKHGAGNKLHTHKAVNYLSKKYQISY